MEICHIYVSPGHNFFGHYGEEPEDFPAVEVPSVQCVAGRGLVGDRFFDHKEDYKGQITFISMEVFEKLCRDMELKDCVPSLPRRNVITRGVDLNELIGKEFEVQGIRFFGTQECAPCDWMDRVIGPDAKRRLRGNGGLRAKILTDGELRSGAKSPAPVG